MTKKFAGTTISDELYEKILEHSVIDGDGYIGEGKFSKFHYKDIGGNFYLDSGSVHGYLREIYYDDLRDTLYLTRIHNNGGGAIVVQEYVIKDCGKYIESDQFGLYESYPQSRVAFMELIQDVEEGYQVDRNGVTGKRVIDFNEMEISGYITSKDLDGSFGYTIEETQRREGIKRVQEKREVEKHAKPEDIAKKKAEERAKQEELFKKEIEERAKQEELAKKEAEDRAKQREADERAKLEELVKKEEIAKKEAEERGKQEELARKETEIAREEAEVRVKQEELAKKEAEIAEREVEVKKFEENLDNREAETSIIADVDLENRIRGNEYIASIVDGRLQLKGKRWHEVRDREKGIIDGKNDLQNSIEAHNKLDEQRIAKEVEVMKKNAALAKKEAEILAREAKVSAQEKMIKEEAEERTKQEEIARHNGTEVSEREAEIARKEVEVREKQEEMARRSGTEVSEREVEAAEREAEIARKEVEVREKQEEIARKGAEIAKREIEVEEFQKNLDNREAKIKVSEDIVHGNQMRTNEYFAYMVDSKLKLDGRTLFVREEIAKDIIDGEQDLQNAIKVRNKLDEQRIAKEVEVTKKMAEIEKQEQLLSEKESALNEREQEIAKKKEAEERANQEEIAKKKEAELAKKDTELTKKDVEIPNKEADVENDKFSSEKIVVKDLFRDNNTTGLDKGSIDTVNDEIVLDGNNASSNNNFIVDLQSGTGSESLRPSFDDNQIGCVEGCGNDDSIIF